MPFTIREHTIPAQHIREIPAALSIDDTSSDATLHLHVKQYIPHNNPNPRKGDITILAFHGNGFCKETYEPIWEELLNSLPPQKRLRGIWIADVSTQGSSYVLNESKLGYGFAWDDHARDVLHLVNHFRDEMPSPILGVGHSMGSVMLLRLANMHPRLFHSVCLLDAWLYTSKGQPPVSPSLTLKPAISRQDIFSDPDKVRKALAKKPVFKSWDKRCLDIYLAHLLRPTPTVLHPDIKPDDKDSNSTVPSSTTKFALRTPKQIEAYSLNHPNHKSLNTNPNSATRIDRLAMPYISYTSPIRAPVSNPTPLNVISHLATLRPRCFFLYGTTSNLTAGSQRATEDRKRNLELTGVESGGSGGSRLGCVSDDWIEGGHLFPFEKPMETGQRLSKWICDEGDVWWQERKMVEEVLWSGRKGVKERQDFDPEYVRIINEWNGTGWDVDAVGKDDNGMKAKL